MKESGGNNYESLQRTQQELGSFVSGYLGNLPNKSKIKGVLQTRSKYLKSQVRRHTSFQSLMKNSDDGFAQAIDLLREQQDLGSNITWLRKEDKNGNLYLIRDARYAQTAGPKSGEVAFQIQFLNLVRATVKLLELQKNQTKDVAEIEKYVKAIKLKVSEQDLDHVDLKVLTQAKKSFIRILKKVGIDKKESKVEERLNTAKDFVAMDDRQYNVATISSSRHANRHVLVVESSNMLTGLTVFQEEQYKNIASGEIPKDKLAKYAWYTSLSRVERALVSDYALRIATGGIKILPTQLQKQLIGVRNAYCKSTAIVEVRQQLGHTKRMVDAQKMRQVKFRPVITSFHCGTASFLGKGNEQEVTNQNVSQLETFLPGRHKKICLNVLNTGWNSKERQIISQALEAAKATDNSSALTPINAGRGFFENKNQGFKKAVDFLYEKLEVSADERAKAAVRYFKSGKEADRKEALEMINDKFSQELGHLIEAKRLLNYTSSSWGRIKMFMYDPENTNLQLAARIGMVEAAVEHGELGQGLSKDDREKFPRIVTKCKSGKDRTGGVEFLKTAYATCDALGIDSTNQKLMVSREVLKQALKPLVNGLHTQTLAAINGGTPGAYGIKVEGISFLPKSWKKALTGLEQDTAKYNDISKYKEKVKGEYITDEDVMRADKIVETNSEVVKVRKELGGHVRRATRVSQQDPNQPRL